MTSNMRTAHVDYIIVEDPKPMVNTGASGASAAIVTTDILSNGGGLHSSSLVAYSHHPMLCCAIAFTMDRITVLVLG